MNKTRAALTARLFCPNCLKLFGRRFRYKRDCMVVFLNEKIKVGAVFTNGTILPRWFRYRGRTIAIKEVTYSWKKQDGASLFIHFSVTDGINLYDLSFQPERLSWNLEAVEET